MSGSLDAGFRRTPIHRALGVAVERTDGGVTLRGVVGDDFARADGMDTMHGGGVATLLDSATTFAVVAETDRLWATVDLRVDFLRPVRLGPVEVVATVVHKGSTVARSRAELRDGSGRLAAVATATLIAERP